ncbi:succinylglutamate desuccinylase [Burkholderia plantarii]|uniref:succinylglutamate desuccinylase n=1 Tax=Burkholderia plantarii TaxID=41899 RepID=UPI0006D897F9|nr:succinylglutamate desuccinylase [Burkholderia plantarii]ALK29826.1 succinylglutamate desuccinylase [Burkholderia plantarii]
MTSSADRGGVPAWLDDCLASLLAGDTPDPAEGVCAGGAVHYAWRGEGLLELTPARLLDVNEAAPHALLVSAGVHGDETAPIELLSAIVRDLAHGALALACRLLIVFGHPAAMRAGTRYLDDDLNRLFNGRHAALAGSHDAPRAARLEAAAVEFFAAAPGRRGARWHLDLHTAIRASAFEQFALLPHTGEAPSRALLDWFGAARIPAVLLHTERGNTYSQFTASACGALASTLELGKVRPFGQNDLTRFAGADAALRRLIAGAASAGDTAAGVALPRVFTVIGQITKQSEAFELFVARDVPNFTPFARGTLLARDGDYRYLVSHDEERIVFPNPSVKPGLRAGLLVVETTAATPAALD